MIRPLIFFVASFITCLICVILHFLLLRIMGKNNLKVSRINSYSNLFHLLSWAKLNKQTKYIWLVYSHIFFIFLLLILMFLYIIFFFR